MARARSWVAATSVVATLPYITLQLIGTATAIKALGLFARPRSLRLAAIRIALRSASVIRST
jgi:hypothetical protein